jgi:hypothetical protein
LASRLSMRFMFCCLSSRICTITFVWDLISRFESSSRFTFWVTDSNIIICLLNRFLKSFITIKLYSNILYFRLNLRVLINFRLTWNICASETRLDRCDPKTCNLCHDLPINPFSFGLYSITIRQLSSTQIDYLLFLNLFIFSFVWENCFGVIWTLNKSDLEILHKRDIQFSILMIFRKDL